jgi:hypothetical protein
VYERGAAVADDSEAAVIEPGPLAADLVDITRAAGRTQDPVARQLLARAHGHEFLKAALSERISQRLRRNGADAGVAAYGALAMGVFDSERAVIGMELARGDAIAWREGDGPGAATALGFLNGRINSIAGGTDQMQRNGISEQVLGLPREPSFDRDKPFDQVLRDAQHWDGKL